MRSSRTDGFSYSRADREVSVALALKLAAKAASSDPGHSRKLVTYARSVANGVVPGWLWQVTELGFMVKPCDGRRNPHLAPCANAPESQVSGT